MAAFNEEIIEALRKRNYTAQELSDKFQLSIATIREFMDRLHRTGIIVKHKIKTPGKPGKPPVHYGIHPDYQRQMPYLKVKARNINHDLELTIRPTDFALSLYGNETNAHKAISNLPVILAQLLKIGFDYNTAFEDNAEDQVIRSLKRQLNLTKKDLEENIEALSNVLNLLRQVLNNDAYWNPVTLAKHFNVQLSHPEGKPIPPLDPTEAIRILEKERQNQP